MKVSEFIEWLKTQDQEATVDVLVIEPSRNWSGESHHWEPFTPDDHSDYLDMRNNMFAKGKPHENDRTLRLGEE